MNWFRSLRSILFVGLALVGLYWSTYLPSEARKGALNHEISSREADIAALQARVNGLAGSGSEIVFPEELIWALKNKADAELAFQDAIVDLASQFGITLITFGTSGLTRDTAQAMMAFEVEAEGPIGQVHAFLAALEHLNPKAAIGMLRLRPAQGYGIETNEDVLIFSQITIWAFWGDAS